MAQDHPVLNGLSMALGFLYCTVWSAANIPQIITNYKRRSVAGYSIEFLVLNMIGYFFYLIYVWVGSAFQQHYHLTLSITIQDKIFATTGTTAVLILATQAFILYKDTRTGSFRYINQVFCILLLSFAAYNTLLGIGGFIPWFSRKESAYTYSVIHYLGFGKSFCSLIKYIPQVILNVQRRSTYGYNISAAILDCTGGSAALLQMFIKCYAHPLENGKPDWSNLFGNAPKLFLALESIIFDVIFLTQHFIIYKDNNAKEEQQRQNDLIFNDGEKDGLLDDDIDNEVVPLSLRGESDRYISIQ